MHVFTKIVSRRLVSSTVYISIVTVFADISELSSEWFGHREMMRNLLLHIMTQCYVTLKDRSFL